MGLRRYLSPQSSVLFHVGERFYDPSVGRFLQRDPIGIFGGRNVYRYVFNAPLRYVDPLGLKYWEPVVIAITGGPSVDPWWPAWAGFWDDEKAVNRASQIAAVVAGTALGPVTGFYGAACATIWGGYRLFGGTSGSGNLDATLDGVSVGIGIGQLVPKTPQNPANKRILWEVMHPRPRRF